MRIKGALRSIFVHLSVSKSFLSLHNVTNNWTWLLLLHSLLLGHSLMTQWWFFKSKKEIFSHIAFFSGFLHLDGQFLHLEVIPMSLLLTCSPKLLFFCEFFRKELLILFYASDTIICCQFLFVVGRYFMGSSTNCRAIKITRRMRTEEGMIVQEFIRCKNIKKDFFR